MKKRRQTNLVFPNAIVIIIFILSFSSFPTQANQLDENSAASFEDYRKGIFHVGQVSQSEKRPIQVEKWLGTAFLVDDHCTFATAKHILRKADRERIVVGMLLPHDRSRMRATKARILYEDSESDLAFLKIDYFGNRPCGSKGRHVFPLLSDQDRDSLTGKSILIIGFPVLSEHNIDIPVIRNGIISSVEIKWSNQPMLLLDLPGVPGFSGSPVILQKTGQAIGVVFGPGPTKRIFGFEWATPITIKDYNQASGRSETP